MEAGGFTIVTKGSRRCAHGNRGKGPRYSPSSSAALGAHDATVEDAVAAVGRTAELLERSDWLSQVVALVSAHAENMAGQHANTPVPALEPATPVAGTGAGGLKAMVCYGLGHFGVSRASALQAGLAIQLRKRLGLHGPMFLYDPVLTGNEQSAARRLGFTLLTVNEVGLRVVNEATLFYMPHCGRRLYSNVLRANWSAVGLARLLIVGNSFEGYRMRMLTDEKAKRSCCVERLGDTRCRESRLPPAEEEDVFADTAVMTFPFALLQKHEVRLA